MLFIPLDRIDEALAQVREFEKRYPQFCAKPGDTLSDEEREANLAIVLETLRKYSGSQEYARIMRASSAADRIRGRKATRVAKCDPASGRKAGAESPDNWRQ
jgi:hypothetical protein